MRKVSGNLILTIARKEFLELVREGRFRWLAGIVSIVFLASLHAGWYNYAEATADRERAQASERERWLNKGRMSGHSAAHFGLWTFRPDSPLSAIDQGVIPYTGTAVFLEAHSRNPLAYRPAADTMAARRYGELTAAAVLQIFVPLLIILLCYPVFVGEREQGTLRQLLSLGVSTRTLGFGKLLGIITPLILLVTPLAFIGVVSLMLYAGEGFTAESWLRVLLMTLAYVMYFAIFAGVSLMVSAIVRSSRQAILILLAFWFMNCLLLPQAASDVAARIYPGIDGFELPAIVANARGSLPTRDQILPDIEKRLLGEYKVERVEDLPVDPKRVANIELDAMGDRIQEEVFNGLHDAYENQDFVYQSASIVAPAMAVQSFSMALCETHFAHYRRFADTAEMYRQELVHAMDQADLHSENARPGSTGSIVQDRETWEKLRPFEYASPGLAWSLGKSFISMIVLMFWFVSVVVLTPLAILRLKVD